MWGERNPHTLWECKLVQIVENSMEAPQKKKKEN
jgi:hypothetical protein